MQFQEVESSNIHAMAHEGTTMQVQFNSGDIYEYTNVNVSVFADIVNAPSVGSRFNALVKRNPEMYPFRRLT